MYGPHTTFSTEAADDRSVADDPYGTLTIEQWMEGITARYPALHHIPSTLMHLDTPQHGSECLIGKCRAALLIPAANPSGLHRLARNHIRRPS
jgi:hypothetical protein